jgi:predicted N-formylglutamate amidohydrolase
MVSWDPANGIPRPANSTEMILTGNLLMNNPVQMSVVSRTGSSLLAVDEGPAVEVVNPDGHGDVIFTCEHASNAIPAALGDLGLSDAALASHIAWDLGALGVATSLAETFDAPLVAPRLSRLVHDCNRDPEALDAIVQHGDGQPISGNRGLDAMARAIREMVVHAPFHAAVAVALARRLSGGRPPALVMVHSFTPTYLGEERAMELGVLHDQDSRLADALLAQAPGALHMARNQPYGPDDGVTYTLRRHALPPGLLNVMLEVRNDLLTDDSGQARVVAILAEQLREALATCRVGA